MNPRRLFNVIIIRYLSQSPDKIIIVKLRMRLQENGKSRRFHNHISNLSRENYAHLLIFLLSASRQNSFDTIRNWNR